MSTTLPSPTPSESLHETVNTASGAVASVIQSDNDLHQMIQKKAWYKSDEEASTWKDETDSESSESTTDSGFCISEVYRYVEQISSEYGRSCLF